MNERDFIILVEQYLDGTLSPEGRTALGVEVKVSSERRRLFEQQARQHIRLHAQTSRVDFTESQHIAMMVVDIAEKHRTPNSFMDVIRRKPFRERLASVIHGLRAGKGTSAYHAAKDELMRVFGPVSISMGVNIALILIVFYCAPYAVPPAPKNPEVSVTFTHPDSSPPELEPPVDIPHPLKDSEPVMPSVDAAALIAGTTTLDPEPVTDGNPRHDALLATEAPTTLATPPVSRPISLKGIKDLEGRGTENRTAILRKVIGSQATETAVNRALRWLQTHQAPAGNWAGQDPTAMTGLALLAFLAHNETPASPEYGETMTHGLKYLLSHQDEKGAFSKNVYAHAIATYAVAEGYTLSRIVELKYPLEKAVQVIVKGQQNNGGFDYNYKKDQRFDTSVTGWQIQALKASKIAGADVAGLDDALDRAARFLQSSAFARDGSGFVYDGKTDAPTMTGGKLSMTGVGTLCLQMLGKASAPQVKMGLRVLKDAELSWPAGGKASIYGGYYVTQAKFQGNNAADWQRWNHQMQKTLLSKQQSDGHWEQGDYDNGSHVYTTALCTLMLEVYYRYLPTYEKRPDVAPQVKTASGEVSVDIR